MATTADVLVATPLRHSLMATFSIAAGTAQLRRNIATFSSNYASTDQISTSAFELGVNGTYAGTSSIALCIYTSGPITVEVTKDDPEDPDVGYSVSVRRFLFLDDALTGFTITNSGENPVQVQVIYADA